MACKNCKIVMFFLYEDIKTIKGEASENLHFINYFKCPNCGNIDNIPNQSVKS